MTRRTFFQVASAIAASSRLAWAGKVARQPYLQRLLADRVSILWTTPQLFSGAATVIGPNGQSITAGATVQFFQPSETGLAEPFYQYQADIGGLQPGTSYSYRIVVGGRELALDPAFGFTTPAPGKFSFLSFGDSGADSPQQRALIQLMAAEPNIAKVIHVGDVAYMSGTFEQFETNYFGLYAPLMSRLPFFLTPGNHDYETNNAAPYLSGNAAPLSNVPAQDLGRYYSFDWGDAHFASVDSNLLPTDAATRMLAWLDADLAATGKFWKIVYLHHPPYPTGTHLGDPICALTLQNVNPIVEAHGVQLVLSGHEHGYERSWPLNGGQVVGSGPSTTYVITGGGGQFMEEVGYLPQTAVSVQAFHYLRVDVDGPQLSFSAIGLNGNLIDQVTLAPPPVMAANAVLSTGSSSPNVASGSLAGIFGQNFAARPTSSSVLPLPTELGGVTVTANGQPVPLVYASPTQLNVQIPYEVSGLVNLQVNTPNGSVSTTFPVVSLAPSILTVFVQNAPCTPANPAVRSGNVTVYATGLGMAASPVATGQGASAIANPMAIAVKVWLGNTILVPTFAGLAPGFAGLSQVTFTVPATLADGVYSLRVTAGTATSQQVILNVGAASTATQHADLIGSTSEHT